VQSDNEVKYGKVNAAICIAHRREYTPLMRYRFPSVGVVSASQSIQPGIQQTLRDHEHGLVRHAISLFSPPAFAIPAAQRAG